MKKTQANRECEHVSILEFLNVPVDQFIKRQNRESKTEERRNTVSTDTNI